MDKKNTLLLTVIAIATLLVAVVGATFAYFSAQTGEGQNANINVKTSTTDTLTFDTKPIFLMATQQNFANVYDETPDDDHAGSQKVISTSTVDYKKGGAGSVNYCYNVTLNIGDNNFEYAPEDTEVGDDGDGQQKASFKSDNAPELLLKITKKTEKKDKNEGNFSEKESPIVYGKNSNQPLKADGGECSTSDEEVKANCVYYESLTQQRKVCTQSNITDPTGDSIQYAEACSENETPEGFDVTVLNNTNATKLANHTVKSIKIPTTDGGDDYKHKLEATNEGDEVKDTWTAELVSVNYKWDQQYNASPNTGNPKKFNATFTFERVECEN